VVQPNSYKEHINTRQKLRAVLANVESSATPSRRTEFTMSNTLNLLSRRLLVSVICHSLYGSSLSYPVLGIPTLYLDAPYNFFPTQAYHENEISSHHVTHTRQSIDVMLSCYSFMVMVSIPPYPPMPYSATTRPLAPLNPCSPHP
jgi:hypothetical protein